MQGVDGVNSEGCIVEGLGIVKRKKDRRLQGHDGWTVRDEKLQANQETKEKERGGKGGRKGRHGKLMEVDHCVALRTICQDDNMISCRDATHLARPFHSLLRL